MSAKLSKGEIARNLGQTWVLLTADDAHVDTPIVETSKGRMILVEVWQSMTDGRTWHSPVELGFFQPYTDKGE